MWTRLLTLVNSLGISHMAMWTMGVNHMAMWTRLLTLVKPLGINHMVLWTRLLTLVQVGDWWKYALEAIIKWLLLYFLNHDKSLLFMLELYWSET